MYARGTMADLIELLRDLIGDPAATSVWTDEQLQRALDGRAITVRYAELAPEETLAAGSGATTYLAYTAPWGYWEDAPVTTLVGSTFSTLTPSGADELNGRWTFAANQPAPVYVLGRRYDVYAAAADVLESWAAKASSTRTVVREGDVQWTAVDQRASRLSLAETYRARQEPQTGRLVRTDEQA